MSDLKENSEENNEVSEEFRKVAKKAQLHPILPNEYSFAKRKELKKFEQELLSGKISDEISYLKWKINNLLRGDAMMMTDDKGIPPEKRLGRMKAIEEIKHYIDNYEENMKLINFAKDYKSRLDDDWR